ncbi:hypothetical protein DQ04_02451030 [Trypanosoma grayi]|uniref:hypothetical protein n=1 Tax=Trypanosoma grayi TaxID=71804 RepID=UPI0004F3F011|nr:hypothetical protein DQ04_02451030 [Trypanosoma grayi]KEG11601.1 hypothetical protein DQ04_02451030 [Trypanosoma grayi]
MLRRCIPGPVGLLRAATCVRSVFTRDLRTHIEISNGKVTYPAVLLWRWKSDRQRHLVLSVHRPHDAAETAEAKARPKSQQLSATSCTPEDYIFGRVFLRPYNVAQLLAALEGKAQSVEVLKEHSLLRLQPVVSPTPKRRGGRGGASDGSTSSATVSLPSAFSLVGELTAKVPMAGQPHTDEDVLLCDDDDEDVEEAVPGTTYNLGDRRSFRAVVEGADLIFIMKHLDAVLSDMFGIEHQYHARVAQELLRKRERGNVRPREPYHGRYAETAPRYRSESLNDAGVVKSAVAPAPNAASTATETATTGANSGGSAAGLAAAALAGGAAGAAVASGIGKAVPHMRGNDLNEDDAMELVAAEAENLPDAEEDGAEDDLAATDADAVGDGANPHDGDGEQAAKGAGLRRRFTKTDDEKEEEDDDEEDDDEEDDDEEGESEEEEEDYGPDEEEEEEDEESEGESEEEDYGSDEDEVEEEEEEGEEEEEEEEEDDDKEENAKKNTRKNGIPPPVRRR